jgi:hypothetical protein
MVQQWYNLLGLFRSNACCHHGFHVLQYNAMNFMKHGTYHQGNAFTGVLISLQQA